jgi:hypothetical protein
MRLSKSDRSQEARRVECLGFMLTECSFAYLGWLKAKSDSKALWAE